MTSKEQSRYEQSGVSTQGAETALDAIKRHIPATRGFNTKFPVALDLGYFANVIDIGGGQGLAFCTDGVGTKVIVAELADRYDTLGIDCVAMNVNDLICLGATPVSMVDYIACSHTDPRIFEELAIGLKEGARQGQVSISGGEISQVKEIVNGIDLIGSAVGLVQLDRVNTGQDVKPGQVVVGVAASGVHSNGLTLARRVLLGESAQEQKQNIGKLEPALGKTIGDELLVPTHIYVQDMLALWETDVNVRAMVNITGGGLSNLNRVSAGDICFVLDQLMEPLPVFRLIQERGGISDAEMYEVFNMGLGFVAVVDDDASAKTVIDVCARFNHPAQIIGRIESGTGRSVTVPPKNLTYR
ncbi:MAG: phosphoribosylformylglycinamidine cyclo-ligase [Nitrospina sp.]|nr:phosphoribosylformylglycinamidine cyclo-ligase [Nitrospina sp.]